MAFEDKRRTKRFDVEIAFAVRRGDQTYAGTTRNISLGGALVEVALDPPAKLGDRVDTSFSIPGLDGPIEAQAEVRWLSGSGLGLQFVTGLRAKQTWALGRFLESLSGEG